MKGFARALDIIQRNIIYTPGHFARLMWPDSPHWKEAYKCGNYGSSYGRGMVIAGGSLLGKLRHRRLIYDPMNKIDPMSLTTKGKELLRNENT